jgi:hypothetical protein
MTDQCIIYRNEDNSISVLTPTAEWLASHTIEELVGKDIPADVPWRIIDVADLPQDRTFRNAWEWDDDQD